MLPILRVLDKMGGSGRPKDVKAAVHKLFEGQLTDKQLTQLEKRSRLGWTRLDMVHQGPLAGEWGVWQMTPLAMAYLEAHRGDPLDAPRRTSLLRSLLRWPADFSKVTSASEALLLAH